MQKKRFERAVRNGQLNVKDDKGTVAIRIALQDTKGFVKGNMSRTLSVKSAKVSEVYEAIENFLFGS